MAALYSTFFGGVNGSESGVYDFYTVPPGFIAVLRDVDASWSGAGLPAKLYLHDPVLGAWQLLQATVNPDGAQWQGRQVYNQGTQFGVYIPVAGWTVRMSGYLLTMP